MHCLNSSSVLGRTRSLFTKALSVALLSSVVSAYDASGQLATVVTSYDATGTWLCPAGVTSITVETWGGGGRGGTRTTSGRGGGGGGGAYSRSVLTVSPGTTYTVTVGAGSTSAAAGGDSWFNNAATILAKGGNSVPDNATAGATGGAAGSGVGTFTFSGGNGANAPAGSGGGGGSSAGTAANGTNATTITGAVSPVGGGNGGNGGDNGGIGGTAGNPGVEPGGGGGGGERGTLFPANGVGGAGAFGKVTITWANYTNGDCLAANQAPIYDFACNHAPTTLTFAVSGLPTTLGSAPGNVFLDNVALIIATTFNADLDITLTSPGGATRNLMLDRFNAGDNIGNLGTCPASPLVLRDGGTALNNTTTNNVVGTFAPEQTLAGFTGNPNGNWTLTICDDADVDFGNLRMARLKFCTLANAGADQSICSNSSATLAANTPPTGAGVWSVVSGPSLLAAQFSNTASPTATFTPTSGTPGTYTLRWQITDSPCAVNNDNVVITVVAAPTTATVGGNQTICALGTTTGLGANSTGAWSVVSGGTGTFNPNNTTANATFTHLTGAGPVVLRWTITGTSPCPNSTADVTITITQPPTTATVGGPQTICALGTSVGLGGNTETVGTGLWTVFSGGTGTFSDDGDPNSTFTHTGGAGPMVLRWTMSNAPCPSSNADVTITITQPPTTATVGGPQTICANGTTLGLGGNMPGVGTGAWSVVSGGTGTFSPDNLDPNATFMHAVGLGPVVVRWTISNAPCPADDEDVSITITQPSVASNAGPDQPIVCSQPGTATMAANAATNGGVGNWTQISGPAATITTPGSPTTTITGMNTLGAYVFRWTITNAPCGSTQDDVTLTVGVCIYYSRATGNVNDPIWSDTPGGVAGAATFTSATGMVVQSPDVVTNTTNTTVDDLTIDASGTLVLNAATLFTASGNAVAINGTLTANNNSLILLNSPVAATLALATMQSVYDLSIDADVSYTVTGILEVRGSLDLFDGVFDATAATVTLRSFSSGTGRLGPVGATASYTGDIKVQRRIPGGVTNWRLLGSSVGGRTVADWQDDFITAGYPGSQYPTFDDPVGSGILWPSIRHYVETNPGALINDGLIGVSSSAQALAQGKGFAAWSGDMLGGTAAFMTDLTGPPNVALTPITLPMTYTNTGDLAVDGWNMVSNPVPSPIAFDQIALGANVEDYVSYYDPMTGNVATWDISMASGTNNGTNTIQSGQGFWLKANGGTVTTTVSETDKTTGNGGGFFGGDEESIHELLRLQLTSGLNTFSDETVVVFSAGSAAVESEDVRKMIFNHPAAPQIGTFGSPVELLAINAYGAYTTAISIPVMVDAGVSGTYTVTATGLVNMGLRCLSLEDLITGTITPLTEGASYSFEMDAATDPAAPRMMLHATVPMPFDVLDATCAGMANGQATVVITNGPTDVTWTDEFGVVLLQQSGVSGDATFGGLAAGSYMVHVSSPTVCGELHTEFTIDAPFVLEGTTVATAATTCADTEDGSVDVLVLGGVEPYSFAWSNGADTEDLIAGAGNYTLTVTDANNCLWISDVFAIEAGGAIAGFTVETATVLVNADVLFTNTSTLGETYFWEFGDGATSTDAEPVHAYALPGVYTVTLTVTNGDCSDVTSFDVTVELNTGISTSVAHGLNAWVTPNGFLVEHNFTEGAVQIEIMDATGRLQATRQVAGTPGRVILSSEGLSTGIWFVRVTNGDTQRTFRLPLLR